jgi:hypothetical protein
MNAMTTAIDVHAAADQAGREVLAQGLTRPDGRTASAVDIAGR